MYLQIIETIQFLSLKIWEIANQDTIRTSSVGGSKGRPLVHHISVMQALMTSNRPISGSVIAMVEGSGIIIGGIGMVEGGGGLTVIVEGIVGMAKAVTTTVLPCVLTRNCHKN